MEKYPFYQLDISIKFQFFAPPNESLPKPATSYNDLWKTTAKKAILSQKYLEIMATMNGLPSTTDPTDPTAIQIKEMAERKLPKGKKAFLFSNREIKGYILPYPENQIKQSKGSVKFSIEPNIYNSIVEMASHQRPTILFICAWPNDKTGLVIFSKEAMSMICTAYWFLPNKKSKPSNSTKNVNVEIPDGQIVDEKAFEKIFDQIYV